MCQMNKEMGGHIVKLGGQSLTVIFIPEHYILIIVMQVIHFKQLYLRFISSL